MTEREHALVHRDGRRIGLLPQEGAMLDAVAHWFEEHHVPDDVVEATLIIEVPVTRGMLRKASGMHIFREVLA